MDQGIHKVYDGIPMAITTPQPNQIWRHVDSQDDAVILDSTENLVRFMMGGQTWSVPFGFFKNCFYLPMQNQQQSTAMDDLKDMKPPQFSDAARDFLESLKSGPNPRNVVDTKPSTASGRQQIIDKMTAAVMSDRNRSYGDPEGNFGNIASYWNTHMEARKPGPLTPLDVAIMMKLMKVARLSTNPTHVDSWVDAAGYAVCGGGIVVSKEEKK